MIFYIVFVAIAGGSSRNDGLQASFINALCAASAAFCLWSLSPKKIAADKYFYIIIMIYPFYTIFQLIAPQALLLPFGGGAFFQIPGIDPLIGDHRAMAISPQGAMSALLAFLPATVALLMFSRIEGLKFTFIARIFCSISIATSIIGMSQIYLPSSQILYFYDVTNIGSAVGIFANRNHNAVFLACSLQLMFFFLRKYEMEGSGRMQWALLMAINFLIALIFVIGSRAGFVFCGIVLIYNIYVIYKNRGTERGPKFNFKFGAGILLSGSLALFFCLFLFNDRIPALTRLGASDAASELRVQALPTFLQMAKTNMPFGVGSGGFEAAYKMVEPYELMGPSYLNHAHNDWLQFIIEGGVVGGVILLILVGMMARASLRLFRPSCSYKEEVELAKSTFVVLVVIALASFVDYPLRTPFFAVFATWCFYATVRVSEAIGDESRFAN